MDIVVLHVRYRDEWRASFHPGFIRRIKLRDDIRDKQDLLRGSNPITSAMLPITLRFTLLPNIRIEVTIDKRREIPSFRVREEKLLGQHASR